MPKISIFNSIKDTLNYEEIEMLQYLIDTRDGRWEDIVSDCRLIKEKDKRDAFKRGMPTATLSGLFRERNDAGLIEHSGFIAMDLDEVENLPVVKRKLEGDKYVYSVFMSTSGNGLRVIFRIEHSKHREAFLGIKTYLFNEYDIVSDPNGVNVSKPYVVSFDPYLYLNPNEIPIFKKYVKETPIKKVADFVHTSGDFESILKQIVSRGINICEDYNDWLKVGFAFSEQFGENGRGFYHEVSRQSQKYKSAVTDKQYNYCLKARGTTKANISTFYYLAKINNVNIFSEQTRNIIRATKNGKKAGLNKEQIVKNLLDFSNISDTENIVGKLFDNIESSYDSEEDSVIQQLEMFITNNYNLRMNEVTGYLEQNGTRRTPSDLNTIFISAKKMIPKLDYQLMMRLLKSDFIDTYNPFYEFFGSDGIPVVLPAIPEEDIEGKYQSPLIDKLSSCIINDNPAYTLHFTRKWIVSIISAAHKVHSPLLHCLLGKPETGKTEFYRRLLPKELSQYYAESKLDKEKDDELLMTENLIIMDDELGGKSKQDSNKLKNITSKQYFSLRRPYGDHNETILRIAVLCGTSNLLNVINDPTPNRRIIPIEVHDIDRELYNSINKKDLFMEAFRLYKEGFDWRITRKDMSYLNQDQDKYETVIKEKELIMKYFAPSIGTGAVYLTTTDIIVEIEKLTNQRLNVNSIGRELENLGFIKKSMRDSAYKTSKRWGLIRTNRNEGLDNLPF